MSITAVELRSIGNGRTGRAKSQDEINVFVKSWVADLTTRGIVIEASEDVTLTDEQPNYVESGLTNAFKEAPVVTIIDSDSNESEPLCEISWHRYKERVAQGDNPGRPKEFVRFNNTFYLWPAPDTDNYPTMRISGTIHHTDTTTIVYADRFRECGIQYIIYKIWESLGYLYRPKASAHFQSYEFELDKLLRSESRKRQHFVRYNDI